MPGCMEGDEEADATFVLAEDREPDFCLLSTGGC